MSLDKATEALSYISSDERSLWVAMGMALKAEFGDTAFHTWDSWSQRSDSYSVKSAKAVWKSIKYGGKTSIASLFHEAKQCGWTDSGEHHEITAEEMRRAKDDRARRERKAIQDQLHENRRAAEKAEVMLMSAKLDVHPYLKSKQLPESMGLVLPDGALFIPMRDCQTNSLLGGQVVRWNEGIEDFEKKMIPGMRAKGAAFRIGSKAAYTTIFCEGYVTGLSIDKAAHMLRLDVSVMVCFSAGNIAAVAGLTRGPRGIFADNDASETGRKEAEKAGLPFLMADTVGWDANDLHTKDSLMALSKKLLELVKKTKQ